MSKVFSRQANEQVLFSTSSLLAEKVILGDNPLVHGREHSEAAVMPRWPADAGSPEQTLSQMSHSLEEQSRDCVLA